MPKSRDAELISVPVKAAAVAHMLNTDFQQVQVQLLKSLYIHSTLSSACDTTTRLQLRCSSSLTLTTSVVGCQVCSALLEAKNRNTKITAVEPTFTSQRNEPGINRSLLGLGVYYPNTARFVRRSEESPGVTL